MEWRWAFLSRYESFWLEDCPNNVTSWWGISLIPTKSHDSSSQQLWSPRDNSVIYLTIVWLVGGEVPSASASDARKPSPSIKCCAKNFHCAKTWLYLREVLIDQCAFYSFNPQHLHDISFWRQNDKASKSSILAKTCRCPVLTFQRGRLAWLRTCF